MARRECKYFRQGRCKKGDACPFLHRVDEPSKQTRIPNSKLCLDFARGADCKAGNVCKLHQKPDPQKASHQFSDHKCMFFDVQQGCVYGDNCRFRHDIPPHMIKDSSELYRYQKDNTLRVLPAEIRMSIFHKVLADAWVVNGKDWILDGISYGRVCGTGMPALIRALRNDTQLYNEALEIFYQTNYMALICQKDGKDKLENRMHRVARPEVAGALKHVLRLRIDFNYDGDGGQEISTAFAKIFQASSGLHSPKEYEVVKSSESPDVSEDFNPCNLQELELDLGRRVYYPFEDLESFVSMLSTLPLRFPKLRTISINLKFHQSDQIHRRGWDNTSARLWEFQMAGLQALIERVNSALNVNGKLATVSTAKNLLPPGGDAYYEEYNDWVWQLKG